MKSLCITGLLFTLLSFSFAQTPATEFSLAASAKSLKWDEPAEPVKIVGPIHFVGTMGLSSWLITTTKGHILLSTGMPGSGPLIEAAILKLGYKPEEIKFILTCHAHVDHVGGHAYMKKISGAKVVLMKEEVELLESGGKKDFHYGSDPEFQFEPVQVDQTISNGDVFTLGTISMTALLTPGHTKGCTTWTMYVSEGGKIYKVVFSDGTSVNSGYRVEKELSYPGIGDDFRKTFKVLKNLHPDIWLSAHTNVFDFETKRTRAAKEGVSAWLDPEGYKKFISEAHDKFLARIKAEKENSEK